MKELDSVFILFILLLTIFLGTQIIYYSYLWYCSSLPWGLNIDIQYTPSITILIPARNEEKTIRLKLLNLKKVKYSKDKMQIIIVDDASTDKTIHEISKFTEANPDLNIEVYSDRIRKGKSAALNGVLKYALNDIIIVTDADTFWSKDILMKALPFLSDPSIGAINGRQNMITTKNRLLTQTEEAYLDFTYKIIKLGESKIYSTILFHGLFSAYKRKFLVSFNPDNDDAGTALDIVQKGVRTIYVPGTHCYELPPITWKDKISTKFRRANQLVGMYRKCLELFFKGKLLLPLRIAIPEIIIYLLNPIIFFLIIIVTSLFYLSLIRTFLYPISIFIFILILSKRIRLLFLEAIQDYCILLLAVFSHIYGKKFELWESSSESRSNVNEELLKNANLI